MNGKLLGGSIVGIALVAGAALYYLQVYAFYDEVEFTPDAIRMTPVATGQPESMPAEDFEAIDADSSPLRYRACFRLPLSQPTLTETYEIYDNPEPLTAPPWFDCFDAGAVEAALESGEAMAFLGEHNVSYGVDRVIAVFNDGRAYAWHQLNDCGELDYAGNPVGEACPPREE
ncbi:histidine kinase [Mesobaculum littorinae]|uniref:Histidine kinase n=1 Tax=Mesobaculum littorinae TaxID=2486419 RepID=A0A438AJ13_9RHOB|nr:DUF6446 family protein [Mesobaculum littorinae]RVV98753.1 histidine kinase [Mesobaculum littorinae]